MDDPISTIEQKTVEKIETALTDLKKNTATKQEVLDLIKEQVKTDQEAVKSVKEQSAKTVSVTEELKAQAETLKSQIRQIQAGGYSALKGRDGNYRGFFGSAQEAKAFGLLIMAAATANTKASTQHDKAMKALKTMGVEPLWVDGDGRKTMTGTSQTGGSALVTIEQSPSFIQLMETYGVFRRRAAKPPMGAGQSLTPKVDSLLTGYCPGEGGEITQDDPSIAVLSMVPKTISYLTGYSIELDEDSAIALAELIGPLMARSMAYDEDRCGFLGDGTSTYFGFKGICGALRAVDATIGSIKSLVVGSGNAYSELVLGDFTKVVGTQPSYADLDDQTAWFMHRYFYYTVAVALALAAGGASATEVILGAGQRQKMLASYPVDFTQVMPKAAANSQICALFGNLYLGASLGIRGAAEFAQSDQRYFEKGIIAIRGRNRIAINAHGVGNTTDAGPIVGLITAAS